MILKKLRLNALPLLLCFVMFLSCQTVYGEEGGDEADELGLAALNAILIEQDTGKILYEKNADDRVYPASMTKILAAMVMLEYIDIDEIIVIGSEIHDVPDGSSIAGHLQGESISGLNLLRALMLPSGNDTGMVIAAVVAGRVRNDDNLAYSQAEKIFSDMLNDRAKSLGLTNTNFVNPHGYHDDNHYTTAKDMAVICKAAMENETIARVVAETGYSGNGVGNINTDGLKTQEYEWRTTNLLLVEGNYYYPYAKGIKTGFHNEAGRCLAAAAEKDGKKLISIVFHSEDPVRWEDSIKLFDYGFDNFDYVTLQTDGEILEEEIYLNDPRLGDETTMEVLTKGEYIDFMSEEEIEAVEMKITFNHEKYVISEEEDTKGKMLFILPIEKGETLGAIQYTLNGALLYEGEIVASQSFLERTKQSDREYYIQFVKDNAFTLMAVPFWLGLVLILLIIIYIIVKIKNRGRDEYAYTFKGKKW